MKQGLLLLLTLSTTFAFAYPVPISPREIAEDALNTFAAQQQATFCVEATSATELHKAFNEVAGLALKKTGRQVKPLAPAVSSYGAGYRVFVLCGSI